jgi:hypothetical protein
MAETAPMLRGISEIRAYFRTNQMQRFEGAH